MTKGDGPMLSKEWKQQRNKMQKNVKMTTEKKAFDMLLICF